MMQLKDYHLSGTFPKRSYRKELLYVLMRNFLLNTSYCNKNQNRQRPASKTAYICGFYQRKLGLHPEMLLSLAYIIKLHKITVKTKTGLLMHSYFLLYVYLTNWYFNTHLTSSLNLADFPFLSIMPVIFYNYFLSELSLFEFWNLEF